LNRKGLHVRMEALLRMNHRFANSPSGHKKKHCELPSKSLL
jgi:hypothetical protein